MFKRRTTKVRRHSRMKTLEVRVMSPRIAWYGFLRFGYQCTKFALVLALLAGLGWGAWLGIRRAFIENPEFQFQSVDLNPNDVMDERKFMEIAEISLPSNLFRLDVDEIRDRLRARPDLVDASVERHLPGTLQVRVTPRVPRAWIACPEAGIETTRSAGDLLVDTAGVPYPCPERQLEAARELPILVLRAQENLPVVPGRELSRPELKRAFRLLDTACGVDPQSCRWIERVSQPNDWSLLVMTRDGTEATFGLGDHERQFTDLVTALDHASRQGYAIATINLIPQRNIPVTTRSEAPPPRATVVPEPSPGELRENRRKQDLKSLLNRG